MKTQITSRDIVLEFIHALNSEDYSIARKWLNDTFNFNGPMGQRVGADRYMQDMEKIRFKYTIRQTFEEGNDVCLIYDILIGGKTVTASGWYHLENGKLESLNVFFDPRSLL